MTTWYAMSWGGHVVRGRIIFRNRVRWSHKFLQKGNHRSHRLHSAFPHSLQPARAGLEEREQFREWGVAFFKWQASIHRYLCQVSLFLLSNLWMWYTSLVTPDIRRMEWGKWKGKIKTIAKTHCKLHTTRNVFQLALYMWLNCSDLKLQQCFLYD